MGDLIHTLDECMRQAHCDGLNPEEAVVYIHPYQFKELTSVLPIQLADDLPEQGLNFKSMSILGNASLPKQIVVYVNEDAIYRDPNAVIVKKVDP